MTRFKSQFASKFGSGFSARGGGQSQTRLIDISGLQVWYSTDTSEFLRDGNGLPVSSGGSIARFLDRSGNGNNTNVQGTSTARPTWDDDGLNGKGVATFDGGDFLAMPSALYAIPNGDQTIFVVSKKDTTGAAERIMSMGITGSTRHNMEYPAAGTTIIYYNNAAFDPVAATATQTNFNITTAFKSGTTQSISINGGTAVTDTAGANISGINQAVIGAVPAASSGFLIGAIAEILIYNRALTAAERIIVRAYLSNKWGIALA